MKFLFQNIEKFVAQLDGSITPSELMFFKGNQNNIPK